ncbi:DUF1573 domain-containing protein [Hymenobacter lapidiphilus]|uniref:DUF1573 domain-containing protein n=1 Tax=Hymenobacter sp. CCM 8763 TaxID=2303334 RepID=UPI000E34E95B|nr:DUF1573 domain-containing protein [Hymenobacter sp. CCM 8763]RFP64712.1 DUF1573 domain-containing protein [Hymenobacter sp. CCM 8763]
MKNVLFLALSLSVMGLSAQAQSMKPANAQAKVAGPQIQFEETKYEFGAVKTGDVVEHVFKFKNVGTQPLFISNIGVTCGCTTPEWTREPIMPGKSGTVVAKFNTAGKYGMQNKVLTVESNSVGGNAMVAIIGDVKEAGATMQAMPASAESMVDQNAVDGKQKLKMDDNKIKAKKKS